MKRNLFFHKIISTVGLLGMLAACTPIIRQTPPTTEEPATNGSTGTEPVTLTYLVDDNESNRAIIIALIDAYTALHPNVTIEIENRPQGGDGDNVVKTRLAAGEMTDLFYYNSGSLLTSLQPAEMLVALTDEPFMQNVEDPFIRAVLQDGEIYGVPTGTGMGGGILYNRKIYDQLGLRVPMTWAEFEANNETIKAAGIAPVIATFGDPWTSQLFVLGDYYNVARAMPNFAQDFTNNKILIVSTPEAITGFTYLQQGFEEDWWQQDYATTKFEQGLKLLADGEGAHYPMLSFALSTIATNWPEAAKDIGFFPIPGKEAALNGATLWMPSGTYIPKTSEHIEDAKDFLAFIASPEGTNAISAKVPPPGPYLIKGSTLPDDTLPAVKDIAQYIYNGKAVSALEFTSPLKGPALEQICVAVGSGQMNSLEAALAYDLDVQKQAQQLGLPGW